MAETKKLKHGGVVVTIDDKDTDVTSEAVSGMHSTPNFILVKAMANIFVFKKDTDYKKEKNQKEKFKKIKLEFPLTQDILDHSETKKHGKENLKLAYFDKSQKDWVHFKFQKLNLKKNLGTVELEEWIKDPPAGWGF
jgi:hypothetical protein